MAEPDNQAKVNEPTIVVEASIEIERSTFTAFLAPAKTENEARAFIASIRAEHPKARHHCSAFVVGAGADPALAIRRSSDDGEPAGTAGTPMLETLSAAGLTSAVVVVVRYFGGILLGASGLTRAYRAAVQNAIAVARNENSLHELCKRQAYVVSADFADAGSLEHLFRTLGWAIDQIEYAENQTFTIAVPFGLAANVESTIQEAVGGRAGISAGEISFG